MESTSPSDNAQLFDCQLVTEEKGNRRKETPSARWTLDLFSKEYRTTPALDADVCLANAKTKIVKRVRFA